MPPALPPAALAGIGVLLLSAMDAIIKHLSVTNGVLAITFGRYLFGVAAAALIWQGAGRPRITREMVRAHAFRGFLIVCMATLFFWSLRVLPLAEAIALSFISPLLIPLFAWGVLGERPRPANVAAGVAGFAGAAIALSGATPSGHSALYGWGVAAVLASAALYAWSLALLRARADRDGAPVVGLLQTLIPCVLSAGPAIALAPTPPLADLPWFAAMGLLGAIGWYALIKAYARAEAQRLAPIEFTALLWASLFGFFAFQETPRPQVYLGAALIIGACLFAVWEERRGRIAPPLAD